MIAYLDTHTALWLASGMTKRISSRALKAIAASELLLSPMALLELEILFEIRRSQVRAQDIVRKLEYEAGLRVCEFPFSKVAEAALDEGWTRDPFDRLIVANARVNGFAPLISADENIAGHYLRTVW